MPLLFAGLLLGGFFMQRSVLPPASTAEQSLAAEVNPAPTVPAASPPRQADDLREPKCLVGAFFGVGACRRPPAAADRLTIERSPSSDKLTVELPLAEGGPAPSGQDLKHAAAAAGYALEFMIALVPDPLDSQLPANFDQTVDAIQAGMAESNDHYLQDRIWLPWRGEAATRRLYERSPGLMLFRVPGRKLMLVFLVGETQKIGLHKQAFLAAIKMIQDLGPPTEVDILGPAFSGSAESLRIALTLWQQTEIHGGAPAWRPRWRVVNGSATAASVDETLRPVHDLSFSHVLVNDDTLFLGFLAFASKLGWQLHERDHPKVAFLVEGDTEYGRGFVDSMVSNKKKVRKDIGRYYLIRFPSRIAGFRTARERTDRRAAGAALDSLEIRRTELNLSLAEQGEPVDLVPDFSPETSRSTELAIANLLETAARTGVRYVGIVATDVKDTLFLGEKVRSAMPQALLFTFDSKLLEAHPQFTSSMNGMLVFANFRSSPEPEEPKAAQVQFRQFSSEAQQGTFLAVLRLLGSKDVPPRIWVSVVGNGSFWPLDSLDPCAAPFRHDAWGPCAPTPAKHGGSVPYPIAPEPRGNEISWFFVGGMLVLLSIWLHRAAGAPHPDGVETAASLLSRWRNRALRMWRTADGAQDRRVAGLAVTAGDGVLCGVGALLLVAYSLPLWTGDWGGHHLVGLVVLLIVYLVLVRRSELPRSFGAARLPWVLAGAVILVAVCVVYWLWLLGGMENAGFLYLRVAHPVRGFSPLLPVACLAMALYFTALLQVKRRVMDARQGMDWPLRAKPPSEPQLTSAALLVVEVARRFKPCRKEWLDWRVAFWLATALLVPVAWYSQHPQPIAEPRVSFIFVLPLMATAFALSVRSLYRFGALWGALMRVLDRLSYTWLLPSLKSEAAIVQWNALKSFGWHVPSFSMMIITVDELKELSQLSPIGEEGREIASLVLKRLDQIECRLEQALEAEGARDLEREITARELLTEQLAAITLELENARIRFGGASLPAELPAPYASAPPLLVVRNIEEFLALRVIAYVRYVFAHLRYDLLGAFLPGLFLLMGVSFYAFEPKRFYSVAVWLALLVGSAVTLWSFAQMDRDAALSAIGNSDAGKISFDRTFWLNVFNYGLVPLLWVLATQFPQLARLFSESVDPLLRAVSSK